MIRGFFLAVSLLSVPILAQAQLVERVQERLKTHYVTGQLDVGLAWESLDDKNHLSLGLGLSFEPMDYRAANFASKLGTGKSRRRDLIDRDQFKLGLRPKMRGDFDFDAGFFDEDDQGDPTGLYGLTPTAVASAWAGNHMIGAFGSFGYGAFGPEPGPELTLGLASDFYHVLGFDPSQTFPRLSGIHAGGCVTWIGSELAQARWDNTEITTAQAEKIEFAQQTMIDLSPKLRLSLPLSYTRYFDDAVRSSETNSQSEFQIGVTLGYRFTE